MPATALEQGRALGRNNGLAAERSLLARQVRRCFGDDIATRSATLLEPITDRKFGNRNPLFGSASRLRAIHRDACIRLSA